jgi:hypothetical protein
VEGAGSFKVTSTKINTMKEQNLKSHAQYVPLYHFVTGFLIIAGLVGACINFVNAYQNMGARLMAGLFVVVFIITGLFYWFIRSFALRAHDKAIRAEENLRYFSMTGKLFDEKLTMGQIVALRFAPNEELVDLASRAAKESLPPQDIKKSIKNWKADYHRV